MENDPNIVKRIHIMLIIMLVLIGAVLGTIIPAYIRPDVMQQINILLIAFVVGYFIGRIARSLRADKD